MKKLLYLIPFLFTNTLLFAQLPTINTVTSSNLSFNAKNKYIVVNGITDGDAIFNQNVTINPNSALEKNFITLPQNPNA